jgi:hypothetical protein
MQSWWDGRRRHQILEERESIQKGASQRFLLLPPRRGQNSGTGSKATQQVPLLNSELQVKVPERMTWGQMIELRPLRTLKALLWLERKDHLEIALGDGKMPQEHLMVQI